MTRSDARQVKLKSHRLNVNLVIVYNPIIKNLETVIRNYLPILYSDPKMYFLKVASILHIKEVKA